MLGRRNPRGRGQGSSLGRRARPGAARIFSTGSWARESVLWILGAPSLPFRPARASGSTGGVRFDPRGSRSSGRPETEGESSPQKKGRIKAVWHGSVLTRRRTDCSWNFRGGLPGQGVHPREQGTKLPTGGHGTPRRGNPWIQGHSAKHGRERGEDRHDLVATAELGLEERGGGGAGALPDELQKQTSSRS